VESSDISAILQQSHKEKKYTVQQWWWHYEHNLHLLAGTTIFCIRKSRHFLWYRLAYFSIFNNAAWYQWNPSSEN